MSRISSPNRSAPAQKGNLVAKVPLVRCSTPNCSRKSNRETEILGGGGAGGRGLGGGGGGVVEYYYT